MIERNIVARQIKEFQIKEFIENFLKDAGFSHAVVKRTPLGEKIMIHTARPGMVVGNSGKNIKDLTEQLREKFELENPQIEIAEVEEPRLNANIVAERIASSLERYGVNKFKSVVHRAVEETMAAGALGIEILLSGKVPGARARTWRVSSGYLKKCGESARENVNIAYKIAKLKSGVVGVIVKIMPPGVVLPDATKIKQIGGTEETPQPTAKAEEKGGEQKEGVDSQAPENSPQEVSETKVEQKEGEKKPAKKPKATKTKKKEENNDQEL